MIDDAQDLLSLPQAARLAPGNPHHSTVWRWCRKGVSARDNSRVYLKHRRFGGKCFVTVQWLNDFAAEPARRDQHHFESERQSRLDDAPLTQSGPNRDGAMSPAIQRPAAEHSSSGHD